MQRKLLIGLIAACAVASAVLIALLLRPDHPDEPLPVNRLTVPPATASASPSAPEDRSPSPGAARTVVKPQTKPQPTRTVAPRPAPPRTPPRVTVPPPTPSSPVPTSFRQTDPDVVPTYPDCASMRLDHPAGVDASHPAYRIGLDLNLNGFACEPE